MWRPPDHLVRSPVSIGGQVHAVPLERGGLGQPVPDPHQHTVAPRGAKGWTEVGPVHSPGVGARARKQFRAAGLQVELEYLAARGIDPRLEQRRNPEPLLEAQRSHGVDVGARPDRPGPHAERERAQRGGDDQDSKGPPHAHPRGARAGRSMDSFHRAFHLLRPLDYSSVE
jgi:hypothetical protein